MNATLSSSERLVIWLATGAGAGRLGFAPGTVGTLWGLPLTWLILQLPSVGLQVLAVAILIALGVPICGAAARSLGVKDPGSVVWDEFVTLPIIFLGLPATIFHSPWPLALGFGLHRLFDISKFPPGRQLERLPGGWGIMADDVAAGLYGLATFSLLRVLVPGALTGG